jgi:hypothetical protein
LNLRKEQGHCDTKWLIELRYKECSEYIIEMILSKLDENNFEESKIKELWEKNEIQINNEFSLSDKINKIISKLNKTDSEYYSLFHFEYNLIL